MSATPPSAPPSPSPSSRRSGWPWWLLLALLALAAWRAWVWWEAREPADHAPAADVRIEALNDRISALRGDLRAQAQRIQQADATNRVLRDELLGMGQRAALIEDSIARWSDPDRHGAQALRLDEAELLLAMGQQRLLIAGDLDGARRAYTLAGGVLSGVDDPAFLSLRQVLVQERAALDELGDDPRVRALARLQAFTSELDRPTDAVPVASAPADASWWRRAFSTVFDIQPRHRSLAVRPADRGDAMAGLQLELTLARAAAERRDVEAWRTALTRADAWLQRLWAPSPELQARRDALAALAALPLSPELATLGSTLEQLRQLRSVRQEP